MAEFIRTGTAAELLGSSRQHVVDLVGRGVLSSHGHGVHRRLDRSEVEQLVRGGLNRDQRQSLWLHRAVAGRVALDPESVLAKARANLRVMRAAHGHEVPWLGRWAAILERGPDQVMRTLVGEGQEYAELRQNSPFAGVLTARQRGRVLEAFRRSEGRSAT